MAATSSATPTAGRREGSAKSIVAEQISQSVQSTSNLLHLMLQSSPSHAKLVKLPRNLLALTSTIKNTELALEQMPKVVSSLDAHVERGLQRLQWCLQMFCKPQGLSEGMQGFSGFSVKGPNLYGPRNYNLVTSAASKREFLCVPHLNTVSQLLSNMQSCHLKSLSEAHLTQQESEPLEQT